MDLLSAAKGFVVVVVVACAMMRVVVVVVVECLMMRVVVVVVVVCVVKRVVVVVVVVECVVVAVPGSALDQAHRALRLVASNEGKSPHTHDIPAGTSHSGRDVLGCILYIRISMSLWSSPRYEQGRYGD